MQFTKKQWQVMRSFVGEQPKILLCSGAKRSGKTFILTWVFLAHVESFRDKGVSFIIGGTNQASIRRNILNDLETIVGKEIKLDKSNSFKLFGNKVYCFEGANSDAWKKVRGFTSAGAYLNEGTALHDTFIKECISRCSYAGARILVDTNPENPAHTVKTDYIDKDGQTLDSGKLNIRAFHFTLDDNEFIDAEYKESIKKATPSGMFYDRDIDGKWVSAEGVVYRDFNQVKHFTYGLPNMESYFYGVDWGYEHFGSIVVIGKAGDTYYLVEEVARQHEEIDFWVEEAKRIKAQYGNYNFYCDSARPEYVTRFKREGLRALNADKAVLSGIEQVASLIKQDRLLIHDSVKRFKDEIYMYAWNERTGEPIKVFDDVLDSLRYALYTHLNPKNRVKFK